MNKNQGAADARLLNITSFIIQVVLWKSVSSRLLSSGWFTSNEVQVLIKCWLCVWFSELHLLCIHSGVVGPDFISSECSLPLCCTMAFLPHWQRAFSSQHWPSANRFCWHLCPFQTLLAPVNGLRSQTVRQRQIESYTHTMWLHKCHFLWKPDRRGNSLKVHFTSLCIFTLWLFESMVSNLNKKYQKPCLYCAVGGLMQNYHLERDTISVSWSVGTSVNPCFASEALLSSSDKLRLDTAPSYFCKTYDFDAFIT